MPNISRADSIAANVTSGNLLAGELFEFVPVPSIVHLLLTQAVIGTLVFFSVGGEVEIQSGVPPIRAAAAPFPVSPDDRLVTVGARAGERLFLTVQNTTGGAIIVQTLVQIVPV